jgi:hypothetical protein
MISSKTLYKIGALLILFSIGNSLFSQSKPAPQPKKPSPTGFGKFKIGKTTIQELAETDSTYTWFMKIDNKIDTTTGTGIQYSDFGDEFSTGLIYSGLFYGKNAKMGLVKDYKINEDAVNLILVFFKDTLAQITTTDFSMEIKEQWVLKYGDGNFSTRNKIVKCTSKYGDYSETETYSTQSWGSPTSKIQAIWEFDVYFDSKCKKQYMDYFNVNSPNRMKLLEASSTKYVSKIMQKIEDRKKKEAIDSDL